MYICLHFTVTAVELSWIVSLTALTTLHTIKIIFSATSHTILDITFMTSQSL